MTLLARNNCFKGGIFLAALSLCLAGLGGYMAFSVFPETAAQAALRSRGIIQWFIRGLAEPSAYVPFWTMAGSAAYSLAGIILIYYFFEKTQSPEILFIGFFVISLAFESIRIVLPLTRLFDFPAMYLTASARVLLFGRYFGLFSLFAASVYAAGLDAQKQQSVFLMVILAALIIAVNAPIDSLTWDSAFTLWNGYRAMFLMVDIGILAITISTFMISAHTRGSASYVFIGIGAFLLFVGRSVLLSSDTWITPLPGLACLVAGSWFVCSRLHLEYLWL